MLIDSHITALFTAMSQGIYLASSHFLLLLVLVASSYFPKRYMLITMLILGLLYDSYYVGIIGIYTVAFPLIAYLMYSMGNTMNNNVFTLFFGWIILITLFEVYVMAVQKIFEFSDVSTIFFVARYLGPTLLLNMITFIIFTLPFKRLLKPE